MRTKKIWTFDCYALTDVHTGDLLHLNLTELSLLQLSVKVQYVITVLITVVIYCYVCYYAAL